jgi:hypothetical protein
MLAVRDNEGTEDVIDRFSFFLKIPCVAAQVSPAAVPARFAPSIGV